MSTFGNINKKPVTYDEEMNFIDDDETTKSPKTMNLIRGNPEQVAKEITEKKATDIFNELEMGNLRRRQKNETCDEDEQMKFSHHIPQLSRNQRILGPESEKMFTSLKNTVVENVLIQKNSVKQEHAELLGAEVNANVKDESQQQSQQKRNKKADKNVKTSYTAQKNPLSEGTVEDILLKLGEPTVEKTRKEKKKKSKDHKKSEEALNNNNNKENKAVKKEKQQNIYNNNNNTISKMEKVDEEKGPEEINSKRSSSGVAGSWEDGEEEFLSADEFGGSNSRFTTPPAEFVDTKTGRENKLTLDGENYRADFEDVEFPDNGCANEEEEFIPVGKNNKKKVSSKDSPVDDKPSPTGGQNRRQNEKRNRPNVATTLGDYLDNSKKDSHHHKVVRKVKSGNQKQNSEDAYFDAQETAINANSSNLSFSYADAAKKSSGETTPQNEQNRGSTPSSSLDASPSDVQLPPTSSNLKTTEEISFIYEENLEKPKPQKQSGALDFVLNLNGKEVRIARGHAGNAQQDNNPQLINMMNELQDRWNKFMSGKPPVVYKPEN